MQEAPNDISTLYGQFEGDPAQYQEIGRSSQAAESRARWPLLAAIQPGMASLPPAVGPSLPPATLFRAPAVQAGPVAPVPHAPDTPARVETVPAQVERALHADTATAPAPAPDVGAPLAPRPAWAEPVEPAAPVEPAVPVESVLAAESAVPVMPAVPAQPAGAESSAGPVPDTAASRTSSLQSLFSRLAGASSNRRSPS